jgi:hypothetical protein
VLEALAPKRFPAVDAFLNIIGDVSEVVPVLDYYSRYWIPINLLRPMWGRWLMKEPLNEAGSKLVVVCRA